MGPRDEGPRNILGSRTKLVREWRRAKSEDLAPTRGSDGFPLLHNLIASIALHRGLTAVLARSILRPVKGARK
jgi:hypothetical protein